MAEIAEDSSPRRARRRPVSRRENPQSSSTRVRPTSTTRQLPLLPLPSDAKRINEPRGYRVERSRKRPPQVERSRKRPR